MGVFFKPWTFSLSLSLYVIPRVARVRPSRFFPSRRLLVKPSVHLSEASNLGPGRCVRRSRIKIKQEKRIKNGERDCPSLGDVTSRHSSFHPCNIRKNCKTVYMLRRRKQIEKGRLSSWRRGSSVFPSIMVSIPRPLLKITKTFRWPSTYRSRRVYCIFLVAPFRHFVHAYLFYVSFPIVCAGFFHSSSHR